MRNEHQMVTLLLIEDDDVDVMTIKREFAKKRIGNQIMLHRFHHANHFRWRYVKPFTNFANFVFQFGHHFRCNFHHHATPKRIAAVAPRW